VQAGSSRYLKTILLAAHPDVGNADGQPPKDGDPVIFKSCESYIFQDITKLESKARLVSGLKALSDGLQMVLQPIDTGERCHAVTITIRHYSFPYNFPGVLRTNNFTSASHTLEILISRFSVTGNFGNDILLVAGIELKPVPVMT
jgi:hypothetical protein